MPYTAEVNRANPSSFLFMIDQSRSMSDAFGGGAGRRKADGVSDAINRLLENLTIKCAKGDGIYDYFHVGVIGYGTNVGPAFSGSLTGKKTAKISEIADAPARLDDRTRKVDDGSGGLTEVTVKMPIWFEPVASGGTPMAEAMQLSQEILQDWIGQNPNAYPPIVINITDGEANSNDAAAAAAKALSSLSTTDGNVLLLNCHISAHAASPIVFPDSDAALPDQYARLLFNMSSVLPEKLILTARSEGYMIGDKARGFAFNADLVELIRFLDIGTRGNLR